MTERDPLDDRARALFDAARKERASDDLRMRVLGAPHHPHASVDERASEARAQAARVGARRFLGRRVYALGLSVAAAVACFLALRARDAVISIGPDVPSAQHLAPEVKTPAPVQLEPSAPVKAELEPPKRGAPRVSARPAPEAPPSANPLPARPPASLTEEVTALDHARAALAAGDPSGALRALDDYEHVMHGTHLTEEATLLRVEALLRAGRGAAAADLARRFIESNPDSPLAERARTFVGGMGARGSKVDGGGS